MTPRYVLWLAEQLPQDSALSASMRGGPEFRPWTAQIHLLAALVNLTHAANRQRAGKKSGSPLVKPPTATRRPRVLPVAEIARRQQEAQSRAQTDSQ